MKINKLFFVFLFLTIVLSAMSSALFVRHDNPLSFGLTGSGSNITAASIIKTNFPIDVINFSVVTGTTATKCYVYQGINSNIILANGSITGLDCTLNQTVTINAGTNFSIAMDAGGSSYNWKYNNTYSLAISSGGLVNWTSTSWTNEAPPNYIYYPSFTQGFTQITVGLSSGSGSALAIAVALEKPNDNTAFISSMLFNASVTPTNSNITNATLFIWFNNGTLLSQTKNNLFGMSKNYTTWNVTFTSSGSYKWNVLGCVKNATGHLCGFASANRTIISGVIENANNFSASAIETSTQNFILNITFDTNLYSLATAYLVYNGTQYLGTTSTSASNTLFTRTITLPLNPSNSAVINSFFWNVSLVNGSSITYFQSTLQNQTVNPLSISSCAGGTNMTLNFTAYDEESLNRIIPYSFQATFSYWIGDGSLYRNLTINNASLAEQVICVGSTSQTYYTNAIISYGNNNNTYNTRNYYLSNATLTSTAQNISLYLLNTTYSTSFILDVKDSNILPVAGAYVYSQRYYPGENIYRTVQIAKTDDNGQSVGFFRTETPDYRFLIVRDGKVVLATNPQKVIPTAVPYTLSFIIGSGLSAPWTQFENITSLQYSFAYNNTNQLVTFSYVDTSGLIRYGRLIVEAENYTGSGTNRVCDINSTASSATLQCNMSGYSGTFNARATISRSPEVLIGLIKFVISSLTDSIGRLGTFIGWLIILTVAMAAGYNLTAGIIMTNVAIWIVWMIGLINFGFIFVFGILAISIIVIAELNT